MKNFLLLTLALSLPISISGQTIFEKYQNNKEVTAITISPKMFQLLVSMSLSSGDPDSEDFMEMIRGITQFRALLTGSIAISDEISQWVAKEADTKDLDLMVSMQENSTDLKLYIKEGDQEGELKSLLMFSNGVSKTLPNAQVQGNSIESVVLLIEGKIALDKIAKLITKMNLPGGDQLKKAGI